MTAQITLYGGQFDGQSVSWPDGAQAGVLTGEGGTLWTYAIKGDPAAAVLTGVAAPPVPVMLTPLAFMARLTADEQQAIATAGQSNASVLLFLLKLAGATCVDATDPASIAGIGAMVAAGLLTAGRGAQILDFKVISPTVATPSP